MTHSTQMTPWSRKLQISSVQGLLHCNMTCVNYSDKHRHCLCNIAQLCANVLQVTQGQINTFTKKSYLTSLLSEAKSHPPPKYLLSFLFKGGQCLGHHRFKEKSKSFNLGIL